MNERQKQIDHFLKYHGWPTKTLSFVAGDASGRQYWRLSPQNTYPQNAYTPVLLVDSCDPQLNIVSFQRIAQLLQTLGFSVPQIYAVDREHGLMVIEDFGNDTFSSLLQQGTLPSVLYQLASDVLIHLHHRFLPTQISDRSLPVFDVPKFVTEVRLFLDVYIPTFGPTLFPRQTQLSKQTRLPRQTQQEFIQAWEKILPFACAGPVSLLLRDYHVDNLMLLPHRSGIKACGLLDFQDAGTGPISYDLISLLEDARYDVPEDLKTHVIEHYLTSFPTIDRQWFKYSLNVLGALRHTRILGIFTKLILQGRHVYQNYLPRVRLLLRQHLLTPALLPVRLWFEKNVPCFCRID